METRELLTLRSFSVVGAGPQPPPLDRPGVRLFRACSRRAIAADHGVLAQVNSQDRSIRVFADDRLPVGGTLPLTTTGSMTPSDVIRSRSGTLEGWTCGDRSSV